MTELPRIPPTGPAAGIKPLKPIRKPEEQQKRPARQKPSPKKREKKPGFEQDGEDAGIEDVDPNKGSSINVRV